jgi:hypothetical protein
VDLLVLALSYLAVLVLAIPKAEKDVLAQLIRGFVRQISKLVRLGRPAIDNPDIQTGEPLEER